MPVESQKSAEDHHKRNKENINDCRGFIVLQRQLAFFLGSGSQKFILDSFKIKRNRSLQDRSFISLEVKRRWMMAQKESDTKSTRAKYFWKCCSRNQNLTVFAVASLVCFRTATLVAVRPVQRYTSSIVLTGQPRTRRLKRRKSITCSLNKYQLNKLRWRINETT